MTPPVFATTRIVARELLETDIDFVAAMLADPEVMRHYPSVYSREQAVAWIARQRLRYERDGHGLWLVCDRRTGAPLGQIGLCLQEVNGVMEPEVGYLLARSQWGRGFATEAAIATRDWSFARYPGRRTVSLIRELNAPSRAVAGRIGMTLAGEAMHGGQRHLVYAMQRKTE